MWRLSDAQYGNAVRDLLGLDAGPIVTAGGTSPHALFSSDAARVSSQLGFEYARAAAQVAADVRGRAGALTGCAVGTAPDSCARQFIPRLAARAFRRPITAEEAGALLAVFTEGQKDGFESGVQLVIEAILQSPSFIYRAEVGTPAAQAQEKGGVDLTAYETATALSFFLLDSIPDPPLWTAAASGRLASDSGVAEEVRRLLQEPRVRQNLTRVMLALLGSNRVLDVEKDMTVFPKFTPALRNSLLTEAQLFMDDLLWHGSARLADLFTSNRSFVDRGLAELYRVPYTGGTTGKFVPVSLPPQQRAGVLTQAGALAGRSGVSQTSVVHRGLYVRNEILCLPRVPMPPKALEAKIAEVATSGASQRAKAEARAADSTCGACHSQFDPLGLLFERYDAVGAHRTRIGSEPVDVAVDVALGPSLTGRIDGAVQLAQRIAGGPEVGTCLARTLTRYALGQESVDPDRCEVQAVESAFAGAEGSLIELFKTVATSPAMRLRAEERRP